MPSDNPTTAVALADADLATQTRLLKAAPFLIDGWCRPRPETLRAIRALLDAKLLRTRESGSDEAQYTAAEFAITERGRDALRSVTNAER